MNGIYVVIVHVFYILYIPLRTFLGEKEGRKESIQFTFRSQI